MPIDILPGSYCGAAPLPELALRSWNLDPLLLAGLLLLLVVLRNARTGPAAVGVLAFAFVSPLCAISVGLFSARVVHHVLLVAVAAPLLAATLPARRRSGVALSFLVSTALLWAWHLPAAYDLALSDVVVYWVMQLTLLGSAVWFWRSVLSARGGIDAVLWSLAGLMQMGALGALLTFAPAPLYAVHGLAPLAWGLTPLADQQLGGLIMWVPAMLPYAAMIALSARRGWWAGNERGLA
ncbi:cytochrome c oxidase assembly protein [Limimaricola variabilis]|uniref:cytochrome c oxidase assembly protein n=1 Tax=Limimaricola variabilis TaxID=1492771 RepID=UPI002AC94B66|nr:cytochrome c oxidase assembly protein [Limimaricola variabilis]WPY94963.1 cytochrome c oxidase assembly protein [Limimaricola variabilis]